MSKSVIIAIDGPAASGKGTLARKLAAHLDYDYLDTGTLYRIVGWHSIKAGLSEDALNEQFTDIAESFARGDLDTPDDSALRNDEIGRRASVVAKIPDVRAALLAYQKDFAARAAKGAVLDGRDIGTIICPQADYKFYVTADTDIRSERRLKELQSKGISVNKAQVQAEMQERDRRDAHTLDAHFAPAHEKILIDTSILTPQEALEKMLSHINPHSLS